MSKNKVLFIFLIIGCSYLSLNCKSKGDISSPTVDTELNNSSSLQSSIYDSFDIFLRDFLSDCFYNQNFDSLVFSESEKIAKYINSDIGFFRFSNPGVLCYPTGYSDWEKKSLFSNNTYPSIKYILYKDQFPNEGFCEPSSDADGLYSKISSAFPKYPVFTDHDVEMHELEINKKYTHNPILIQLKILHKSAIIKDMTFIWSDNKWWLVIINDCDCSA